MNTLAEHPTPEQLSQHEQLWQYVNQYGNLSALQERNRIARDIHDSLGQALTALNIQLQTAVKLWQIDPVKAQQFLAEAQRLGSSAIQEVRQTVSTLRTDASEVQSLDALIASLVKDFQATTGTLPSCSINLAISLPQEVIIPLYRIVQEALNNICKYADATEVQICVNSTPTAIYLKVDDNGNGFKLEHASTGFGLQGMRERVAMLNGTIDLKTAPGCGCQIVVEIPLPLRIELPANFVLPAEVKVTRPQIISSAQCEYLEHILIDFIGPIAPSLLQQVLQQVDNCAQLVENLRLRIHVDQQVKFDQKVKFLFDNSPVVIEWEQLSGAENQTLDDNFIQECERELTNVIGPIASFLMQQVLKSSPQISPEDLVETLAAKIPVAKALEFRQQFFERSDN